jgi:hypothetical protein
VAFVKKVKFLLKNSVGFLTDLTFKFALKLAIFIYLCNLYRELMPCLLSSGALWMLSILSFNGNLCRSASYSINLLETRFKKRFPEFRRDPKKALAKTVQELQNRGYLVELPKKDGKFYIPNLYHTEVFKALDAHRYPIARGVGKKL